MAFSDLGSLGATGSTANNQATLVLTTSAAASAGELVVLVIADDNAQTSTPDGDGHEVSSVTDNSSGGPNLWNRATGYANEQGVAQAGAAVQIWYSVLDFAISNGGTITITFSNATNSDATGVTARHFSFSGTQVAIENVNVRADDAADPGSLDCTTTNSACLRIRGIAGEVGNNTSLTGTASWTVWDNGNSATSGTTAEMCARAEHIISTATGAASDPTWVSCDNASAYVAFKEVGSGVTFLGSGLYSTNSASTSISPALPPLRKNGNLLLAFAWIGTSTTASVSGTGWTLVETVNNGSITQAWAWCLVNGSEGAPSFSWSGSSSNGAIILQYCNTDQSSPIGAHNNGLGNGTTISVSAVTTTRDNSLVIAIMENGLSANIAAVPTNYTDRWQESVILAVGNSLRVADEVITTSGTGSDAVSVAISSSANWRGVIAEILSPLASTVKFRRNLSQLGARMGSRQRVMG